MERLKNIIDSAAVFRKNRCISGELCIFLAFDSIINLINIGSGYNNFNLVSINLLEDLRISKTEHLVLVGSVLK
jgi:hypothetical protein